MGREAQKSRCSCPEGIWAQPITPWRWAQLHRGGMALVWDSATFGTQKSRLRCISRLPAPAIRRLADGGLFLEAPAVMGQAQESWTGSRGLHRTRSQYRSYSEQRRFR